MDFSAAFTAWKQTTPHHLGIMDFFPDSPSYYYSWSFHCLLCINSELPSGYLSAISVILMEFYPFSCTLYWTFSFRRTRWR